MLSLSKLIIGTVYNPNFVLYKYYSRKGLCWLLFAGVRSLRRKRRGQRTSGQRPSRNQLNGVGRHRKPLSRVEFAGHFPESLHLHTTPIPLWILRVHYQPLVTSRLQLRSSSSADVRECYPASTNSNKYDSGRPMPGGAWSPSLGPVIAILAIQICHRWRGLPTLSASLGLGLRGFQSYPATQLWTACSSQFAVDTRTSLPRVSADRQDDCVRPALRRKCRLDAVCRCLETRQLSHRRCLYFPCGRLPSDMQNGSVISMQCQALGSFPRACGRVQ